MNIYDYTLAALAEKTKTMSDRCMEEAYEFAKNTGCSIGEAIAHIEKVYSPAYRNAFELAGYSSVESRKLMDYCDHNDIPYQAMLDATTGPVKLEHPTPLEILRKAHVKELRRIRMQYIGWKISTIAGWLIKGILYTVKLAVLVPVAVDRAADWLLRKARR